MAKLWEKNIETNDQVIRFTVGNDYKLDNRLVKYDCVASIAHAEALAKAGIISQKEKKDIVRALREIIELWKSGKFNVDIDEEDCHTKIENFLTEKLGNPGKKLHTARSRNDQVITALRLYYLDELNEIKNLTNSLIDAFKVFVKNYGSVKMPGFTHTRKAMPTNVKMWAESFIEALKDDLRMLNAAICLIDQSPLGTGAGFGIPVLKIDRRITQKLLGFSRIQRNPIYVQNSRGKFEAEIVSVLTLIAYDINKFSTDIILFSGSEMKIFEIPDVFTTGSSIMPQKKNPDVFEIARANYFKIVSLEMRLKMIPANLISGYHRDLQLTKEALFEAFDTLKDTLSIVSHIVRELKVDKRSAESLLTEEIFATEKAYNLVKNGLPFRDAYKKVAEALLKKQKNNKNKSNKKKH